MDDGSSFDPDDNSSATTGFAVRGFYSAVVIAGVCAFASVAARAQPSPAGPSDGGPASVAYLFPPPGATRVPPRSLLLIRFADPSPQTFSNLASIVSVRGSESGPIPGEVLLTSDGKTVQFRPEQAFRSGESVDVRLTPAVSGSAVIDSTYSFRISTGKRVAPPPAESDPWLTNDPEIHDYPKTGRTETGDPVVVNGISIPSDFPFVDVAYSSNPAPGYVFLNNWGGQPYNLMIDEQGNPVWYRRTPDRRRDFKLQPDGRLTMLVRSGYGGGQGFIALDNTYTVVDTMRAKAGYDTDEHELRVLPDGSYYLIGIRSETVDMSAYIEGGQTGATVAESVIQGFTPTGELTFLWRAWDHFDITRVEIDDLLGGFIRFPHMNAIDIDEDGNILLSSRHLSEVTKIDRTTGDIVWRLGGYYGDLVFLDEPFEGFRNQHAIRGLGNGRYLLFDNGNGHNPPESRAVEYQIDLLAGTATRVWQYRHQPAWYTPWMANAERLPNGNTFINYADASLPKAFEVRPDGSVAFEMDFVQPANTYRAFKFEWQGVARVPNLVLENSSDRLTLLFNKFGDPDIDHYNIYGGTSPAPTEVIATSPATFIHLTNLENHAWHYFRVTAVDSGGAESDYSEERFAFVNFVQPGGTLTLNGDFSSGLDNWTFETSGSAAANASVAAGQLHIQIQNGGADIGDIRIFQSGLPLTTGRTYRLEYDARGATPRFVQAIVTGNESPWTNYARNDGYAGLGAQQQHVSYDFVMEDDSDPSARITLNAGGSSADVYIDNVFLKEIARPDPVEEEPDAEGAFRLYANFPNPFREETEIRYELGSPQRVTLTVYDLLGREVKRLDDGWRSPGLHRTVFEADGLPAGLYFYQLESEGSRGPARSAVRRFVHIK